MHRILKQVPSAREPFWRSFIKCAKDNPAALRYIVMLTTLYLHLGTYAQHVVSVNERRMTVLDLAVSPPAASCGECRNPSLAMI